MGTSYDNFIFLNFYILLNRQFQSSTSFCKLTLALYCDYTVFTIAFDASCPVKLQNALKSLSPHSGVLILTQRTPASQTDAGVQAIPLLIYYTKSILAPDILLHNCCCHSHQLFTGTLLIICLRPLFRSRCIFFSV